MAVMTLLELRTAARQRANQEHSEFVSDAELTSYVNQSLAELHGLVVQSFGEDYFITETDLSYAANAITASLPSDFFKARGVSVLISTGTPNRYATLRQYNYNTRNSWASTGSVQQGVTTGWWSNLRSRIAQGNLELRPPPDRAVTVRLAYIPVVTELVDDTDSTEVNDSLNGWLEYVIVDAAIKMKDKEETDTTVLQRQREAIVKRIESETANRDAGDAETIRDAGATGNDPSGYGVGGGWW